MAITSGPNITTNSSLVFNVDPGTLPITGGATLSLYGIPNGNLSTTAHPTTEAEFDTMINTLSTIRGHNFHEGAITWSNSLAMITRFGSSANKNVPAYITQYGFASIDQDNQGDHSFAWIAYGQVYCPSAGTYSFYLDGDDAFDLYVNGVMASKWYGGHGFNGVTLPINAGITDTTVTIPSAGWYPFRARFDELGGGYGVAMGWKKPGETFGTLVPAENLRPFNVYNKVKPTNFNVIYNGIQTKNNVFVGNGSNNAIVYQNDTSLDSQNITVEAWIKPAVIAQAGFIFEKGNVNTQYSLFIDPGSSGQIYWRQIYTGTGQSDLTTPASVLSTTSYNHLVATYTSGSRKIYLNGVEIASDSKTGTLATNSSGSSIGVHGGFNGTRGYYYNGEIGQVKVYNTALSASQILDNFTSTRTRFGV